MIGYKVSAVDNNPAGASAFVAIAQPIGIDDGDLLLASIVINQAGISITPPDDSWTLVRRTDPAQPISMAVYWKTAMNEPARWVFALSSSADAEGAVVAYGGADGFEPVEAQASALTPSGGTTTSTPAIATSVNDEELVVFLGALDLVSYATPAGFISAASRQQVGTSQSGTVAVRRRNVSAAGKIDASSVSFTSSGTPAGVCVSVVLNPSVGRLSLDQVRERFIQGFPRGVKRFYDLTATGDYFKLFQATAQLLKVFAFDFVDLLHVEKFPRFTRYLLPVWERTFGVSGTFVARAGTVPQRQAQILACWRALAGQGSSIPAIQAVIGPILGYFDSTKAEILACSRSELDLKHSYAPAAPLTISNGATGTYDFSTVDGGIVSSAGVRLTLEYSAGAGDITVMLRAPDGRTKSWDLTIGSDPLELVWGKSLAGAVQGPGLWRISITNNSGGSVTVLPTVITEGVCAGLSDRQNTAAAIFHWGVYADPDHLGENGVPADFDAARRAIQRLNFTYTIGNLIQSKAPYPGVGSGEHAAIPGECLPCAN